MTQTLRTKAIAILGVGFALMFSTVHAAEPKKAAVKPAPVTAPAKGPKGLGKGDTEFGVFANFSTYDDQNLNQLTLGASFGKFLGDKFEFRVTPVLSFTDSGTTSAFVFAPFISGEFVFLNQSPVAPFVGGGIGIQLLYLTGSALGDTYGIGLGIGPTGGVKFFVSERLALELALTYQVGLIELFDEVSYSNSGEYDEFRQDIRLNYYF